MPEQLLDYETFRSMRDDLSRYASERLDLSPNSYKIFDEIYLKNLEGGEKESVPDRMAAVAVDIASASMRYLPKKMPYEEKVERIREEAEGNLELYVSNDFRGNTPTNINMGRWGAEYDPDGNLTGNYHQLKQLGSACFVLPVADTFGPSVENLNDGILDAWVHQQQVHKGGGGTGFSFQRLRPKGSLIGYNPAIDGMNSTNWEGGRGVSSGYESFLVHDFNESTDAVKQGNSRRGANMGIQRIDHADVLDHIFAKFGRDRYRKEQRMKNFNLSLAVTDEFMEAVINDGTYTLYNPLRADPANKRVLENKFGVEHPEMIRRADLATREQFEAILKKNEKNTFNPLTTPSMYIDKDNTTVINAYNGEAIGLVVDNEVKIYARKIFDTLAKLSHSNGEPGMVFLDRMNEFNPNLFDEEIEATNPCGEQPLPPYDACNLGSINLGNFVRVEVYKSKEEAEKVAGQDEYSIVEEVPRSVGRGSVESVIKEVEDSMKEPSYRVRSFDWNRLRRVIPQAAKFLDNVIDRSDFPSQKIDDAVKKYRNTGLGYMGVQDAMIGLKLRYGSEKSLEFAEDLARVLHEETTKASQELAKERGAYPMFGTSFHNPESELYKWLMSNPKTIPDKFRGSRKLSDKVKRERVMTYGGGPIRNTARTTQAPTGTIRRSVGVSRPGLENLAISSGIEPIFTLREQSNILNSEVYDWSVSAAKILEESGLDVEKTLEAIKQNKGSAFIYKNTPKEAEEILGKIPTDVRDVLVTAAGGVDENNYEINHKQHIGMLAAFQRYNDSATSKTINMPSNATVDMVKDAWMEIWKSGAKGGTVYRDKSREFQILNVDVKDIEVKVKGKKRPLAQRAIVLELPYISSIPNEGRGDLDFNPDRIFTTIAYNPINGGITGIFQSSPEVDPERISSLMELCIDKSRAFKQGRSLDEMIEDLEKMSIKGAQKGLVVDEAVIPKDSNEVKRFEISGATTSQARLNTFYFIKFLTDGGKNFDSDSINERFDRYYSGEVTVREIIGARGKIELKEDGDGRPSILRNGKVLKLPETPAGCVGCIG